jgi:hypothetical protein
VNVELGKDQDVLVSTHILELGKDQDVLVSTHIPHHKDFLWDPGCCLLARKMRLLPWVKDT